MESTDCNIDETLEVDGKITHIGTKMSTGSNYKTIGDNIFNSDI